MHTYIYIYTLHVRGYTHVYHVCIYIYTHTYVHIYIYIYVVQVGVENDPVESPPENITPSERCNIREIMLVKNVDNNHDMNNNNNNNIDNTNNNNSNHSKLSELRTIQSKALRTDSARWKPTCHILPPSEIDVGLCLAVFAGSGGKYLFHRIG